jgi:hypothetical protein
MLPDNIFFEGEVPEGYSLAVCPSKEFIIIDVDRHGEIDGFDNIPNSINQEIQTTLHYKTKNNGEHFWFKYTGNVPLANKSSNLGIDLRTNKGYVVWYPKEDVRNLIKETKESSLELNLWLENMFGFK